MADRANILIIDDEMGPRESLKIILKPYYNVYVAERGGQAIELLKQVPIDLVTVDLKMPGLSGIKVLEKIKEHDPDVEAIIITGYGSMDTAIDGLRLGAFDYISKPFDVKYVLDLVRRALQRRNARKKLKELKSDFLGNVSHELRTPMSVVMGFVSLLLDQFVGKLSEEQQRALEKVYKSSEELLELIDNVLLLTSLNGGDLSQTEEEFDLAAVVNEITKRYENLLTQKGVRLSVELPAGGVRIVGDSSKIARIFQNLLHNAVKFTLSGGITVTLRRALRQGMVELEIADTGIGMPQEQIESMFQPFHQMDGSPARRFSGLGLGLTVARRLTDFLGGSLEITSQPAVGTRVHLNIPARATASKDGLSAFRV